MRTGWDRFDMVQFLIASALVGLGAVDVALLGEAPLGILLIVQGLLIAGHRWPIRQAHNNGWIMGRGMMLASMSEARARGMNVIDWVIAEAERDGASIHYVAREPDE